MQIPQVSNPIQQGRLCLILAVHATVCAVHHGGGIDGGEDVMVMAQGIGESAFLEAHSGCTE